MVEMPSTSMLSNCISYLIEVMKRVLARLMSSL